MAAYDAATARALLERAVAHTAKPALSTADIDLLLQLAESVDDAGETVYTSAALNQQASTGWMWKRGLTADKYDLGGGTGVTLDQSQWHAHCAGMAQAYATGEASSDGTPRRSGNIGSISVIGSAAASYWESHS